jgi:hypothetical protein
MRNQMAGGAATAPVDQVLALFESICTSPEHVPVNWAGMSKDDLQVKLGLDTADTINLDALMTQLRDNGGTEDE